MSFVMLRAKNAVSRTGTVTLTAWAARLCTPPFRLLSRDDGGQGLGWLSAAHHADPRTSGR